MLLQAYGLFALFRLGNGQRCVAGTALRTGVIASLFGWGIFLLALGRRHMVIHLMQRSMNPAETPEVQAQFEAFALAGHVDMAGLLLGFLWVYPIASILVGLGLVARFGALDIYKVSSYGLVIIGAAGLVNFVVAQHAPTLDLNILLVLNNVFCWSAPSACSSSGWACLRGGVSWCPRIPPAEAERRRRKPGRSAAFERHCALG